MKAMFAIDIVFPPSQVLQIMVGLLNIGLGAILDSSDYGASWQMHLILFPYWLGGLVSKLMLDCSHQICFFVP